MRRMRLVEQLGLFAAAMSVGGCMTTVQMPATELPKLSTRQMQASDEWPEVRTAEGPPTQIMGKIETLVISAGKGSEPIVQPFAARINGPFLEVMGPRGMRGFPITNDLMVRVEYDDMKKRRNVTGGVLVGVGAPLLVSGIAVFGIGSNLAGRGDGFGGLFTGLIGGAIMLYGTVGILGGLGMTIPGIFMLATDPKKPSTDTAKIVPELRVGPTGANFSVAF